MNASRILIGSALVAIACACSSKGPTPRSSVRGTVARDGYASPPTAVIASDERGKEASAPIAPDGSFSTELAKGHAYRLWVATATGRVPVVHPRRSGRLDTRFRIASDGVRIDLGRVRHLASVPASGFKFGPLPVTTGTKPQTSHEADCVDCVDDDNDDVECEDGSHGNDDNVDVQQEGDHVDANQEMAVPGHNAPESANGCDHDDGEDNDDDNDNNGGPNG